jgi:hypothetical protein
MQKSRIGHAWCRLVLVWTVVLFSTGCGGIEHISVLRQAQNDFSTTAREENQGTVRVLFPDDRYLEAKASSYLETYWKGQSRGAESLLNTEKAQALYNQYQTLYLRLKALENNAKSRLEADGLYGTCASLRVFSHWRATFYGHALRIEGETQGEGLEAMTVIDTEAKNVLANFSEQIQPRDRFFLLAMPGLTRYDIALLRFLKADMRGSLNKSEEGRKLAKEIVDQITAAEKDIRSMKEKEYRHLEIYKLLSRYAMLLTAYTVANRSFEMHMPEGRREFPVLVESIDSFYKDVDRSEVFGDFMKEKGIERKIMTESLPIMKAAN